MESEFRRLVGFDFAGGGGAKTGAPIAYEDSIRARLNSQRKVGPFLRQSIRKVSAKQC